MEEEKLKSWIRDSKLEIKLPDFEDNVMSAIQEKEASEKSVWRNVRWSWFFFFVGLGLGLVVTNLFSTFGIRFLGNNSNIMLVFFEIGIIAVLATQFDKLIRITFRK